MALAAGTRLGAYEIRSALGAGGMGEVYRARDTKLNRDVAIKVVSQSLAADPERLARFEREAHVLASLNHPNIAQIYGLEDSGTVSGLVLELVEGPTLADRIAKGRVPWSEAAPIVIQIADALEAAHEQGIIHRDLKPANIKLRPDGTVKVLDFGLAKLAYPSPIDGGGSEEATVTTPAMTQSGVIVGTAAYLSPEQARSKPVDRRADIWALGCVLYEMLTGRAAFARETIAETLAQLIEHEPTWEALPANTPSDIRRLLHRCLEKDPRRRLRSAADVRIAIEDVLIAHDTESSAIPWTSRRSATLAAWLIASVAIVVAVTAIWSTRRRDAVSVAPLRLDVNTAPTSDPSSFALSPDGRQLVFVALEHQTPQLWLRQLDQTEPQRLAETDGASYPFWAPSGRSIGFFAGGWLKRLDLTGGRPQVLAQARNPLGGAWNRDDLILYSPSAASPLMRVSATGGIPNAITRLAPGELSHRFPAFLPDGRRFLLLVLTSTPKDEGVYLGSTDAPDARHRLLAANSAADFATPGYLLMVREGALIAVQFDVSRETVAGDPITLARDVTSVQGRGAFSVSSSGLMAYRIGSMTSPVMELAWIGRNGATMTTLPAGGYLALTSDGQHIALSQRTGSPTATSSNTDIWLLDTARGVPRRFTFDNAFEISPVWSPDGSSLVFASNRNGVFDLFEKPLNFARDERVLLATRDNKFPMDWSPDGQVVLFVNEDAVTGDDLWTVSFEEPHKLVRLLSGRHAENQGQFSPDGRWLAYRSNESGQWEIYLRSYPGPGSQQLVSRGGGIQPRWRHDGRELFYVATDSRMMAVSIHLPSDGERLELGPPMPLFTARLEQSSNQQFGYAVDPDGQRFLMRIARDQTNQTPITVVQNWQSGLAARER